MKPLYLSVCFYLIGWSLQAQSVQSLTLIDADTDADIGLLVDGQTLNLATLPTTNLSVRANTSPSVVGSVRFSYDGNTNFQTENVAPYALKGDTNGDYNAWTPTLGTHTLTATPYAAANAGGTAGTALTVVFSVINQANLPEPPTNLVATALSTTSIYLDWEDAPFGNDYSIERSLSPASGFSQVDASYFGDSQHTSSGLQPNTTYYFRVKTFFNGQESAYSEVASATTEPVVTVPTTLYAINAGGPAYTATDGTEFSADQLVSGGRTFTSSAAISGTDDDPIYRSERYGNFTYELPVANGNYQVTLLFAEIYFNEPNKRVFDVSLEGQEQVSNLDVFSAVGKNAAYSVTETVEVTDGSLTIDFSADINNAKLSGVLVGGVTANPPAPPTGLSAAALSSSSVRLSWNEYPERVEGYYIEQSVGSPDNFTQRLTLYYGYTNFVFENLTPNTTYYYRIRVLLDEYSSYSATASATTEAAPGSDEATVSGELRKWHKVTLGFDGPAHQETDVSPNPFLDYRLNVTFSHAASGKSYVVPGYFAADGQAAETSASAGNQWMVHFRPDETGAWNYTASFRSGANVAISTDPTAGAAASAIDGLSGSLTIDVSNKTGRDFRALGRLEYVGERYLRFAETGDYFVKGGSDAPENFLAYDDFDNTPNNGGRRKSWSPHAGDWNPGNPSWQGGKGTEMIGALNYLASEEANAFSFLTMNINGDDKNVYPYLTTSDFKHFDVSKLDQWEIVFEHAQTQGLYLHFKTQETENDQLLDGGDLGVDRKLYYRMLIARFGHHLALNWNLGEENDIWSERNDPNQTRVKAYAQYIRDLDPFDHHIVIHSYPGQQSQVYDPLLGNQSQLTGASVQTGYSNVYRDTKKWVDASLAAGKPWVVANDEQGGADVGVPPDLGYVDPITGQTYQGKNSDGNTVSVTQDDIRKKTLWGNLMAGGAGVEYYYGYKLPQSDLSLQDYRSRDLMWDYTRFALQFFNQYLPFAEMTSNANLVGNGWCLAKAGEVYAIYLENGGTTTINLGSDGATYDLQWYNPRTGGSLQSGSTSTVTANGSVSIGNPPGTTNQDWVALLRNQGSNAVAATAPTDVARVGDMVAYPVPLQDQLTIDFEQEKEQVVIEVVDFTGTVLQRTEKANAAHVAFPIVRLSPGAYYLRVSTDGQTYRTTVIKSE
ncbi:MAG: malectin domain-containing carbohydrate-binding protein [Tunicatimonas sp.]